MVAAPSLLWPPVTKRKRKEEGERGKSRERGLEKEEEKYPLIAAEEEKGGGGDWRKFSPSLQPNNSDANEIIFVGEIGWKRRSLLEAHYLMRPSLQKCTVCIPLQLCFFSLPLS